MIEMSATDFEAHVSSALDRIPPELVRLLDNVVILVEDDPPADGPSLLGLYEGVPLTDRDSSYGFVLPDRIFIYRNPTLALCRTTDEVIEEIEITVVHEIAHHFGIDDHELDELGYG